MKALDIDSKAARALIRPKYTGWNNPDKGSNSALRDADSALQAIPAPGASGLFGHARSLLFCDRPEFAAPPGARWIPELRPDPGTQNPVLSSAWLRIPSP